MDVIYILIPVMIFLGLAMVVILIWAVRKGQYEDLEGDAYRIIMDDDDPMMPGNKKSKRASRSVMPDAEDN